MRASPWLLLSAVLIGCGDKDDDTGSSGGIVDADGDGVSVDIDCDDDDAAVGAPTLMYLDGDGDGFGVDSNFAEVCSTDAGYAASAGDCDDSNSAVNPGAEDLCDGIDNNCNGLDDGTDAATWYMDNDGDGYGGELYSMAACEQPDGPWFAEATDCDDADPDSSPKGVEVCDGADNDCDGTADEDATDPSMFYADSDGDGYGDAKTTVDACSPPSGYVDNADDCDDADAAQPGLIYADRDGDGYGDASATGVISCGDLPGGYTTNTDDCDDSNAGINPGAVEICDDANADEDCSGAADDADSGATGQLTWYPDGDGDGYGDGSGATVSYCDQPSGYALDGTDCDDSDSASGGGGAEICDGIDNDCDGVADWGMNVPNDYSTIGDALAAAGDGDTICVGAGTYTELIDTDGVSVSIEGYDGPTSTIIDGGGDGPVVSVSNGETVSLSGVSVTGGDYFVGAAVYVDNADVTLSDVVIDDNACTTADDFCYGLVYGNEATLTFNEVDVTNNMMSNQMTSDYNRHYGLTLFVDTDLDWTGGSIADNYIEGSGNYSYTYTYGWGLYAQDSTLSLDGVDITGNEVESTASSYDYIYGLLYLYRSDLEYSNGSISENTSTSDYYNYHFISSYYGSSIWMEDAEFTDNNHLASSTSSSCYAYYFLYNYYSDFAASNLLISDNTQQATCSSTAYAYYNLYNYYGTFVLEDSTWASNTQQAVSTGSTAYAYYRAYTYNGILSFDRVLYADNTQLAETSSGSAYTYYGFYASSARIDWTNVIFSGNSKEAKGTSSLNSYYGYLYNSSSSINLENVDVVGNSQTANTVYSGFIYATSNGTTNVTNSVFADNTVSASSGYANIYYSSYSPTSSSVSDFNFTYNDVYNNTGFSDDFSWSGGTTATYTGTDGNLGDDPMYADTSSSDSVDWDLSLDSSSTLIDAGNPALLDWDGSSSDMGAYGGPNGRW